MKIRVSRFTNPLTEACLVRRVSEVSNINELRQRIYPGEIPEVIGRLDQR
nr:hypothetical protein [uncultured Spirosoma sp.]